MNILKSIFLFIVISSTYGQNKNDKQDIVVIEPKSTKTKIQQTWKSLDKIQKEWIKVEKDKNGFLIYDPCDGSTPTIKLDKGFLVINSRLEGAKFSFEKFTRIAGNKSFRLDAYNKENKSWFEVKAKIIDNKKGIVLWEFSDVKWLMTPIENKDKFRQIKNNCPREKRNELKFLPVTESVD